MKVKDKVTSIQFIQERLEQARSLIDEALQLSKDDRQRDLLVRALQTLS